MKCTHPHFCYDWDSMFITPLMPEFESCVCECDGVPWKEQDYKNFHGLVDYELQLLQDYMKSIGY